MTRAPVLEEHSTMILGREVCTSRHHEVNELSRTDSQQICIVRDWYKHREYNVIIYLWYAISQHDVIQQEDRKLRIQFDNKSIIMNFADIARMAETLTKFPGVQILELGIYC